MGQKRENKMSFWSIFAPNY